MDLSSGVSSNSTENLNPKTSNKKINLFGVKRIICHPNTAFVVFFFLVFFLFRKVMLTGGDDEMFSGIYLNSNLSEFLTSAYKTWTGRLSVISLFYYFEGPLLFLWKWLSSFSITISAYIIYLFIVYRRDINETKRGFLAYASCFSFLLISSTILSSSVFWITGALAYLVPFSIALIAYIPFYFFLRNREYKTSIITILYALPAIFTALGQEQISLSFSAFSLLTLLLLKLQKRHGTIILWIIFIITISVQFFSINAPGNSARLQSEISTWFPTFLQIDLNTRGALSLHFIMNTIFNQWYSLLILLWLINAFLLCKTNSSKYSRIIAGFSLFFSALVILRFVIPLDTSVSQVVIDKYRELFYFHYLSGNTIFEPDYIIPYLVGGISLLIIPISIYMIYKEKKLSISLIIIYLASLASIIVITFSPTLYASGGRTSFVSSLLLLILILFLFSHDQVKKTYVLPIILIGLIRYLFFYSTWATYGYDLWYGVLNTNEIIFSVLGH